MNTALLLAILVSWKLASPGISPQTYFCASLFACAASCAHLLSFKCDLHFPSRLLGSRPGIGAITFIQPDF